MFDKKVLAIDYGTKRVGLALNHATLAEPLGILPVNQQLLNQISQLVIEHDIELILVGISENQMAAKTEKFVAELRELVSIPIEFIDETFSSHQVHHKLAHSHMKKSRRQQPIDHFAAAEMLQEWLETTA